MSATVVDEDWCVTETLALRLFVALFIGYVVLLTLQLVSMSRHACRYAALRGYTPNTLTSLTRIPPLVFLGILCCYPSVLSLAPSVGEPSDTSPQNLCQCFLHGVFKTFTSSSLLHDGSFPLSHLPLYRLCVAARPVLVGSGRPTCMAQY
jgi:hypothetical protein